MWDKNGWGLVFFSWHRNKIGVIIRIINGVILERNWIGISGIGLSIIQFKIDPLNKAPVLSIIIGRIKNVSVSM